MIRQAPIALPVRSRKIPVLYAVVAVLHCLLIFLPLWYFELRQPKQKVNLFRVKIGPSELSSGPVVGPPERARRSLSKPQPEPDVPKPQPKAPEEPVVQQRSVPPTEPKIPSLKKPVPKKQNKPSKPVPKKQNKPAKTAAKKQNKPAKTVPKKTVKPKRSPQDGVFQSEPAVMDPRTPVGNRNAAQTHGKKFDGKAPGGGANADLTRYGKNLERAIYSKWKQPAQSHIGDSRPETVVEFTLSSSGKVLSSRIVSPSGNPAMEESVKALLATLDILPVPPYVPGQKVFEIQLVLKTK